MKLAGQAPIAAFEPAVAHISDHEFLLFQTLIQRETGIQLPESKRALLVARLGRRLRALRLSSFGAYHKRVTEEHDAAERRCMIDLICTNETRFFREPKQFEWLERSLLPVWAAAAARGQRARRVRAWSAACSSGEEPYSLAMVLLARLPGWDIEILGSDLSTRVLARAQAALWPIEAARAIPRPHLERFMLRGVRDQQGRMKASLALRDTVRFEQHNLHLGQPDVRGPFDLILCRNVLIYFSSEGRAAVLRRLVRQLAPDGHLFLGHAETLNGLDLHLPNVGPNVYRHVREA
jgi:chemotaxis protein methyltransferase CheR